jgi:hypothetical protein
VHELRRADDCIDGTGVDAQRAADALLFVHDRNSVRKRELHDGAIHET